VTLGSLPLSTASVLAPVKRARDTHGARLGLAVGLLCWAAVRALLRDSAGLPNSLGYVAAPVLSVLAWALVAAIAREVVAARYPRQAAFAPVAVVGVVAWLRQVPEDFRWWTTGHFAPLPFGGPVPLPGRLDPSTTIDLVLPDQRIWLAWQVAWLLVDAGIVLGIAHLICRYPRSEPTDIGARPEVARANSVVAVITQTISVVVVASTAALLTVDEGADFAYGARVVQHNAVLLTIALAAGLLHHHVRRLGLGLTIALALDVAAVKAAGGEYNALLPRIAAPTDLNSWQGSTPHLEIANALIIAAMAFILLLHRPLARALSRAQTCPEPTLWLALAANTVDAVATWIGLSQGAVDEGNPVVRQAGLGLKWVVVTLLLLALWRLRPQLLWIVTASYLLVVAYHLIGATLLA
jgi:hypothetical protein